MKKILVCCITILFLATSLLAQESDDFDDFASLFDDAEDIVVEEGTAAAISEVSCSCPPAAPVSKLTFSGSTSAAGGAAVQYKNGAFTVLPVATFSSTLAFDARIDSTTSVHGAVKAAFPGDLQFSLSTLYLDALLGSTWITMGKKSTAWGNSRIFSGANSSLAASAGLSTGVVQTGKNPNLVNDSGNGISVLLRRPTGQGELAVLGYTTGLDIDKTKLTPDTLNAAFCYDTNIGLTGISVLGRWYEKKNSGDRKLPVLALEQKRTVAGFDVYAQEQLHIDSNAGSVPKVLTTAGLYRIWEAIPRMALCGELQDEWSTGSGNHDIRLGIDWGISRLGKSESGKVAVSGCHSFPKQEGFITAGYVKNGIIPHANLNSGIKVDYSFSGTTFDTFITEITAATTLSLSLSY